jgi:hypothetical protein
MSEASYQRSGSLAGPVVRPRSARPIPLGFGLLIGAAVSLGLWFAVGWGIASLLP